MNNEQLIEALKELVETCEGENNELILSQAVEYQNLAAIQNYQLLEEKQIYQLQILEEQKISAEYDLIYNMMDARQQEHLRVMAISDPKSHEKACQMLAEIREAGDQAVQNYYTGDTKSSNKGLNLFED